MGYRVGIGLLLAAIALGQASSPARVTYTRSFKGSQPAFLQLVIREDGAATYEAKEKDGDPLTSIAFTASPGVLTEVFAEVRSLDGFAGPKLQSKEKVAYTGDKMLAFDDAARHNSQEFTYTKLPAARSLVELFEKISTAGMDAIRLQRALRYQPLNVLDAMQQMQSDWDLHQIAEPQIMQAVLEQTVASPTAMDAARHRAQKLLDAIAKAKSASEPRPAR